MHGMTLGSLWRCGGVAAPGTICNNDHGFTMAYHCMVVEKAALSHS
jgi:hypothetical protein